MPILARALAFTALLLSAGCSGNLADSLDVTVAEVGLNDPFGTGTDVNNAPTVSAGEVSNDPPPASASIAMPQTLTPLYAGGIININLLRPTYSANLVAASIAIPLVHTTIIDRTCAYHTYDNFGEDLGEDAPNFATHCGSLVDTDEQEDIQLSEEEFERLASLNVMTMTPKLKTENAFEVVFNSSVDSAPETLQLNYFGVDGFVKDENNEVFIAAFAEGTSGVLTLTSDADFSSNNRTAFYDLQDTVTFRTLPEVESVVAATRILTTGDGPNTLSLDGILGFDESLEDDIAAVNFQMTIDQVTLSSD